MARGATYFIGAMIERARALPVGWWLLVVAITGGTDLLDFFATGADSKKSAAFIVTALLRVLLAFWIIYAVLRRLAEEKAPMRVGLPFLKSALFLLVAAPVQLGVGVAIAKAVSGDVRSLFGIGVNWAVVIAIAAVFIRLQAWLAALAVGDRQLGLVGAWRRLAGFHAGLALAVLVTSPIVAAHLLLTVEAQATNLSPLSLALLAAVDGIVSGAQVVLGCALAVVAWRTASAQCQPLRETAALA